MIKYKPHYACFECRKTFKRKLMSDINGDDKRLKEAKCPQCGELMADIGLDFESPKRKEIKEWEHLKTLFSVGITFYSCGCTGPGYIPRSQDELINYFEDKKATYQANLAFWRSRKVPQTQSELDREHSKYGSFVLGMPEFSRKKPVQSQDAVNYWLGKLNEVQQKLDSVRVRE